MQFNVAYNRNKVLAELDALISENPRIRLYEVARTLGVDRHTIDNAMRSRRNMSFREYKRSCLLRAAKTMLGQPHLSVKEIGIKLGYGSASSFSRFIQDATGKTPSQLRNEDSADRSK
jgi:methylphosphotriester-DNA--protein-cysteine methyltransferase